MPVMAFDRPEILREEEIVLFEERARQILRPHAPEARVAKWRRGQDRRARDVARGGRGGPAVPRRSPRATAAPAATTATRSCSWRRLARKGVDGFGASLHNAIVAPYILHYGSEEQKRRWLPRMATRRTRRRDRDDRARRRLRPAGRAAPRAKRAATNTSSTARRPSSPTARPPIWSSSSPRPTRAPAPRAPR